MKPRRSPMALAVVTLLLTSAPLNQDHCHRFSSRRFAKVEAGVACVVLRVAVE